MKPSHQGTVSLFSSTSGSLVNRQITTSLPNEYNVTIAHGQLNIISPYDHHYTLYNSTTRLNDCIFSPSTSAQQHKSECVFRSYVYLTTHRDFFYLHVEQFVFVFVFLCGLGWSGVTLVILYFLFRLIILYLFINN
jgi:hypothetical protein